MPYTLKTAPPAVKKALPDHAVAIWVAAFNNALAEYKGEETKAFGTAWAAVKKDYEKNKDGEWVKKKGRSADDDLIERASDAGSPGDYLVVEDPKKPSTWHLRVKVGGKPDHRLMGAAWAALTKGYRGNKYTGP